VFKLLEMVVSKKRKDWAKGVGIMKLWCSAAAVFCLFQYWRIDFVAWPRRTRGFYFYFLGSFSRCMHLLTFLLCVLINGLHWFRGGFEFEFVHSDRFSNLGVILKLADSW
jgi:hypothetical protein